MRQLLKRVSQAAVCAALVLSATVNQSPLFANPPKPQTQTPVFAPNCAVPLKCANVCVRSGRCKVGASVQAGCLLYACRSGTR
jgi:hypothetical protein